MGVLFSIVSCRPCYADSRFLVFCTLFLLTVGQGMGTLRLLRIQVVILYVGAALNKTFDVDWQTGIYLDYWLSTVVHFDPYIQLKALRPNMLFAKLLSWSVILSEWVMALTFLHRRHFQIGVAIGLIVHGCSVIIAGHLFGSFVLCALIGYLAFLKWPEEISFEGLFH